MRFGRLASRKWRIFVLGLVLVAVGAVGWSLRDPWPPRAVIRAPGAPVGFTFDGEAFVTMSMDAQMAWNLTTGKPRPAGSPGLRRMSLASDGRSVVGVTGEDRSLSAVVWVDLASGRVLARFPDQAGQILAPTVEDGGRTIRAVVIGRNRVTEVVTWDVASGAEVRRSITGPVPPGSMAPTVSSPMILPDPAAISPDGRTWAYLQINPSGYILWNSETDRQIGGLLEAPPEGVGAAAFSPDGRKLVIGGGISQFNVWDLAGPRLLRTIQINMGELQLSDSMVISPDGRTLASAWGRPNSPRSAIHQIQRGVLSLIPGWPQQRDSEVILIDLATGQTSARSPNSGRFELSPDGRTIVTDGSDGTFSVRDVPQPSRR